jgi:hypothetical protein
VWNLLQDNKWKSWVSDTKILTSRTYYMIYCVIPSSTEEICTVTFSVCCSSQVAFLFNSLCSIKVNDLLTEQSKRIGKRPKLTWTEKEKPYTHTHTQNVNKLHNFNGKALSLSCVKQNAQERTQTNKPQITKTQIFQQILNL